MDKQQEEKESQASRIRLKGRPSSAALSASLQRSHIFGLKSLGPLFDIKLHTLTLCEGPESIADNGTEMNEDVPTLVLLDKTIPFPFIKPLHFSFHHSFTFLLAIVLGFRLERAFPKRREKPVETCSCMSKFLIHNMALYFRECGWGGQEIFFGGMNSTTPLKT
jgi:hypothetical protein